MPRPTWPELVSAAWRPVSIRSYSRPRITEASRVAVVVPFQTNSGGHYLYDDVTGMVFASSSAMEALVALHATAPLDAAVSELAATHPESELASARRFIAHWEGLYGAFYRSEDDRNAHYAAMQNVTADNVNDVLSRGGFRQLVLTLTENCNLRCKYCAFSDMYPLNRVRSSRIMTREIGRRAIEYFVEQARCDVVRNPWRKVGIGFYGGEPLLGESLLRELVIHAEQIAPCPIVFSVTTNGTLLDGSIVDFLVEHDVHILVSLDGYRQHHDRNRTYADGRGSFDDVVERLRRFRTRYPDYTGISTITVLDWKTDLDELERFYKEGTIRN